MKDRILKTLEFAIMAPSGDNCQPWQFAITGNVVKVYNLPEKDNSLYNLQQRASYIAHGALLENLTIAAQSLGLSPEISYFPEEKQANLIASVTFSETDKEEQPLLPYISQRHTNREMFQPVKIDETQREAFLNCVDTLKGIKVSLTNTEEEKNNLAAIICNNDRMVFENQSLHDFLFHQIRWNNQEVTTTRDGLDIETLGLNAMDKNGFKILKHWSFVNFINNFGLSRIIGKKAEKTFKSASAIGYITIPGTSSKDYLMGGRAVERVWLEVTKAGLSFHPIAGIAFLMQLLEDKETADLFDRKNRNLLEQVRDKFIRYDNRKDENILMFFRVGLGKSRVARSLRYELERTII